MQKVQWEQLRERRERESEVVARNIEGNVRKEEEREEGKKGKSEDIMEVLYSSQKTVGTQGKKEKEEKMEELWKSMQLLRKELRER